MSHTSTHSPAMAGLSDTLLAAATPAASLQQSLYPNEPRWQPGQRLHHLFEARVDALVREGRADHLAVDSAGECLSYAQLEARANQLAHWLLAKGYGPGSVVALLLDKSAHSYITMLAVQKIHAAYVPLDPAFPEDRVAFIVEDARVSLVLSLTDFAHLTRRVKVPVAMLDECAADLQACPLERPDLPGPASDAQLAYVIYTSGSTGKPKGVPISQANIVNFVNVAAEVYGYQSTDRVYQGLTIAFDFAVEEIWVPLVVGATLLPNQTGSSLLGDDLHRFLVDHHATAMCCVPTLLQTIENDLPLLRLLIVSGEACPRDLIQRWWSPTRSVLNAYGPTETTVTATLAFARPDEPVTIGQPLPTYTVLMLAPGTNRVLPFGEEGEICVAGIGVAAGYLNRPDQSEKAFIADFLGLENNPSGLIYRTGDLGCINDRGQVEYRGRIDLQVKVRGYRIELTEIESTLLQVPGVGQAVVDTFEPLPGAKELVVYYTVAKGGEDPEQEALVAHLREELPSYMVPAYYERLDTMPMLASDKADRKSLPAPRGQRMNAGQHPYVAPGSETGQVVAGALADLLQLERVSAEDHFFQDLGASSLLMARLGAALRKQIPGCQIAMRDFYTWPTVNGLAEFLDSRCAEDHRQITVDPWFIPSRFSYLACGSLQMLTYVVMMAVTVLLGHLAIPWVFAEPNAGTVYLRSAAAVSLVFLGWMLLSLSAKWTLIGRWKEERVELWSPRFFRIWLVKLLVQANPMAAFKGSPLFNLYLRLLGARIGRNVVLEVKQIPLCTDLLEVGDHAVVRQDARLVTHKARSNYLYTGPVRLGHHVAVGEGSLVDMHTRMGDRSQLAHASALLQGQAIPAGEAWHGNPARRCDSDFRFNEAREVSTLRVVIYSLLQLLVPLWVLTPLLALAGYEFTTSLPLPHFEAMSPIWFVGLFDEVLLWFIGVFLLLLAGATWLTQLANRFLQPGQTYVLYGFHYTIHRLVRTLSNVKLFVNLFGDSSYITGYLRRIGYHLPGLIQTGSNFGMMHRHDNPALCTVGRGTMISDGLHMMNVQESSTAFRLLPLTIGEDNFIGNVVYYPAESCVGVNCLLATKVMLPIDGPVRTNTGLLGSPCFEIPRAIEREAAFEPATRSSRRESSLPLKNRHNLWTMLMFMSSHFSYTFITVVLMSVAAVVDDTLGGWVWLLALLSQLFVTVAFYVSVERGALGFGGFSPTKVSIYDAEYWRVERYWKLNETVLRHLWKGTPMRNVLNRWLGMKVGKMVYDEGVTATEKTLVEVGDYCNFNDNTILQSHSLEDGIFKSDYIKIGNRCTLEPQAFVQYGVTTGDNVLITCDACVIKAETLACQTCWSGNPAHEIALEEAGEGRASVSPFPNS